MGRINSKNHIKLAEKGIKNLSEKPDKFLLFSLRNFDITQGQNFNDWEQEGLLSSAMELLKAHSDKTIPEAEKNKLKIYNDLNGSMPKGSEFKFPATIKEKPLWASLRLGGSKRIVGHITDNIFYIVFLDKDHKFYPSEKKHT
jgi:hypothetical protein